MRLTLRAFAVFAALAAGSLASTHSAAAPDYPAMTIKFGDIISRNFGYYQGIVAFKEQIEKRSGDRIKVEILTDGKMGTPKDALEALQLGAVQMAMNTPAYTQSVVPEHTVWNLPYLIRNRETWRKFAYGPVGKEIGDKIEAKNIKFLTWCSAGGRGFLSKKPLATPADFAGQKIRAIPDPIVVDTIKSFSGQPVVMNIQEVYTSLQQGVLDGSELSIELVTAFKFHEAAKYYTETQHILTPGMVVANLAWWRRLNKDTQQLIEEIITSDFRRANDGWFIEIDPTSPVEKQRAAAKTLTDRGVTIVKADIEALRKASAPVIDQYKAKIGKDLVERVMAAVGY
jgi:tripartite ATP-independent transporter DctP family solute receptor